MAKLKKSQNEVKPVKKKILILSANPRGNPILRIEKEVHEIRESLRRSKFRDQFENDSIGAVYFSSLRRTLLDYQPHIVHFIGHGNEKGLLLEDEIGFGVTVSDDALSGLFALLSPPIECVILNACCSEPQAIAISEHIPYVVGMRKNISDNAGIEFAVAFYDTLGAGRSVDDAFKVGCNAILKLYPASSSQYPIPILMKKKEDINESRAENETSTIHLQQPGKISKVAVKAHNGKYVTAIDGGGGNLVAKNNGITGWEIFNLIEFPGRIANLQVPNGQYVIAEKNGELVANQSTSQILGNFKIISLGDNKIALQVHDGHFVSFNEEEENKLIVKKTKIRANEIFTLTKLEPKEGGGPC